MPRANVEALLRAGAHHKIVAHAKFSPRLVEAMTNSLRLRDVTPEDYVKQFLALLDNPVELWRHAYEHQITRTSRTFLMALASMPHPAAFGDVADAHMALHEALYSERLSTKEALRAFEWASARVHGPQGRMGPGVSRGASWLKPASS